MALFQDLHRGQIISSSPIASALAAGTVVKLGASGWAAAADETEAQGVLMVDVVAAETEDSTMVNIYDGGITGMAAKIYAGDNGPVDIGDCVCLTPQIDANSSFTVGGKVYVGNGLLYDSPQNSGAAIGTVLEVETEGVTTSRLKVSFKFVV